MKKAIYILLGGLALVAALMAWQRQERIALLWRLDSLRAGNTQLAAGLQVPKIPKASDRQNMQEEALAAVQAVLAMPAGPERDAALNAGLLLQDLKPEDALEVLPYFSTTGSRDHALEKIFMSWGYNDPAAAVAASGKMADKMDRYHAQKAVVTMWGMNDPERAMAWVQTLPDGVFKAASTEEMAKTWASNDLPGVLAWLQQAPAGEAWDEVFRTVSAKWADNEPQKALDYLFRLPTGPLVGDTIANVVTAYAKTDPVAAAAYVGKIPDPKSQQTAALAVGEAWGAKDHAAAAQWALSLPEGDGRDGAIAGVAQGWGTKDEEAALAWAQGLPDGEARLDALYDIVMQTGMRHDHPQQAADIAAIFTNPSAQQMAYQAIAEAWAGTDPDSAMQWLQGLPAGLSRDLATWRLAVGLSLYRTATAEQLAKAAPVMMAIQSSKWRTAGIEYLAPAWLKADRPAAEAWVEQTDLPDATKQELLHPETAK